MEDFESIALGLVATPAKGNLDGKQHIEFSHSELSRLAQFPNSTDYNITLKILEGECEKLETDHMRQYKDKELFERTGLIAVAARLLYEKYMKEVNYHAAQFASMVEDAAVQEEVKALTPQQILINSFGM
jgi:hypothetical protein